MGAGRYLNQILEALRNMVGRMKCGDTDKCPLYVVDTGRLEGTTQRGALDVAAGTCEDI